MSPLEASAARATARPLTKLAVPVIMLCDGSAPAPPRRRGQPREVAGLGCLGAGPDLAQLPGQLVDVAAALVHQVLVARLRKQLADARLSWMPRPTFGAQ